MGCRALEVDAPMMRGTRRRMSLVSSARGRRSHHACIDGAWAPSDESDLGVWLRADMGVTLVSGDVSVWADQSGNGRDVSQSIVSNRPTMGVFNLRAAVLFATSSDERLDSGVFAAAIVEPFTVYAVMDAITGYGSSPYIMDKLGGTPRCAIRYDTTVPQWVANGTAAVNGGANVSDNAICLVADGIDTVFTDDDFSAAAGSGASSYGIESMRVGGFRLGGASGAWNGTISELIVFESAHDAAMRATVAKYFNGRYGLAIT